MMAGSVLPAQVLNLAQVAGYANKGAETSDATQSEVLGIMSSSARYQRY